MSPTLCSLTTVGSANCSPASLLRARRPRPPPPPPLLLLLPLPSSPLPALSSLPPPALPAALTALTLSNAHTHHRHETGYPYMGYRARDFPWGPNDLIGTK